MLLADAEFKLVACQRKLSEGKVKDCANSTAKVNSLKEQSAADRQAAITANTAAITAKQSALDKEREAHALPIAKSFAELFGSTIATGAVIAALIAALIFEISHSLTIYNEWRLKLEIDRLEGSFKQLKVDYFHQTGKQFEATDFKEGEIIDLMEMRESGKIEHFKDRLQDAVQPESEKKGGDFGFIRHGQTAQASARLDAENRARYPQEIIMPMTKRPTPHDYGAVPRKDLQNALQTSVVTDTTNLQTSVDAYSKAESAAAGTVINCPNCGKPFRKVNRFHIFCSHSRKKREDGGNCSDEWHNSQDPARLEALKAKSRRRKV